MTEVLDQWGTEILAGLSIIVAAWAIWTLNRVIRARHEVENARSQVDVHLQRRRELIPNLVTVVNSYATHERETLGRVIRARQQASSSHRDLEEAFRHERRLGHAIRDLIAVVERYPELQADQLFKRLHVDLVVIEDRIAASRQWYNDSVTRLQDLVDQLPGRWLAYLAKIRNVPPYFRAASGAEIPPRFHSD